MRPSSAPRRPMICLTSRLLCCATGSALWPGHGRPSESGKAGYWLILLTLHLFNHFLLSSVCHLYALLHFGTFQVTLYDTHKRHSTTFTRTLKPKTQESRQPCKLDNLQPAIGQHAPRTTLTAQRPRVCYQAVCWPAYKVLLPRLKVKRRGCPQQYRPAPRCSMKQASSEAVALKSPASEVPSRPEHASPAHELDVPTLRHVSCARCPTNPS